MLPLPKHQLKAEFLLHKDTHGCFSWGSGRDWWCTCSCTRTKKSLFKYVVESCTRVSPPPTQRFVLGELIMCSQAGGSWVDGADELPSSFTRRYVMGTRCQSAFCNQPVSNPAVMDRNIWAQWPRGSSMAWNDHGWASCFDHNKRHNKRCGGCVTRTLSLFSIFSPNNKPLNFEEGESTRDTKNKHCWFAMCARVHILWVFLKIRLRDKPGPLYCR